VVVGFAVTSGSSVHHNNCHHEQAFPTFLYSTVIVGLATTDLLVLHSPLFDQLLFPDYHRSFRCHSDTLSPLLFSSKKYTLLIEEACRRLNQHTKPFWNQATILNTLPSFWPRRREHAFSPSRPNFPAECLNICCRYLHSIQQRLALLPRHHRGELVRPFCNDFL
jgi:hypothetical protein